MSTFEHITRQIGPFTPAAETTRAPRRSFWATFYDALIESQATRAQREIDRKLGSGTYQRAVRMTLPE
jgi:hypothetical protein